jgi:ADP-heptose:LPS heptosyltransferase
MTWRADGQQGNEAAKIKHLIVPYTRGRGLDLGCGPWEAWPHFISVDNFDEYRGVVDPRTDRHWRPDIVSDATDLSLFADRSLDFVFSSHLLEHLGDYEAALEEWWRVIKVGGHLVLYLPHKDFYPNIGEEGGNPDHKHDFQPEDIELAMLRVGGWDMVRDEVRDQGNEYSFLQIYQKLSGKKHRHSVATRDGVQKPRCLVIRYGGFGDMIQSSSILPHLKNQGYHITLQTAPKGYDVVKLDPHIDEFWVQDIDQVPNEELNEYWEALGREFEHVINLSETVEGTLLAMPGRRTHAMPKAARHMTMNINYLEFTHAVADLPPKDFRTNFYASAQEKKEAEEFRAKLGPVPVVLWALAGSSVHKVWPWTDRVVSWLLKHVNAKIVFVGGPECQLLERAVCQTLLQDLTGTSHEESDAMKFSDVLLRLKEEFGGVNRVLCKSGQWSIRQTLTFIEMANVVVGPETGVLNAAGMLTVPKVVLLSHSTPENLTKHWVNCTAIEPPGVDCYPCHRLHYSREFCPEDKPTGASVCAAAIPAETVYDAIGNWVLVQEPAATDREPAGLIGGAVA